MDHRKNSARSFAWCHLNPPWALFNASKNQKGGDFQVCLGTQGTIKTARLVESTDSSWNTSLCVSHLSWGGLQNKWTSLELQTCPCTPTGLCALSNFSHVGTGQQGFRAAQHRRIAGGRSLPGPTFPLSSATCPWSCSARGSPGAHTPTASWTFPWSQLSPTALFPQTCPKRSVQQTSTKKPAALHAASTARIWLNRRRQVIRCSSYNILSHCPGKEKE